MNEEPTKVGEIAEPRAPSSRVQTHVVSRRDELGRPFETVEVADPIAASHWRDEDWHRLR